MEEDRTGETEPVLFLSGRKKMALKSYTSQTNVLEIMTVFENVSK